MTGPVRIQRRRTKGWRLPAGTRCVDRSSRWGNPFPVEKVRRRIATSWDFGFNTDTRLWNSYFLNRVKPRLREVSQALAEQAAVDIFRACAEEFRDFDPEGFAEWIAPLRWRNLACWCALDTPCHADVLLELANR